MTAQESPQQVPPDDRHIAATKREYHLEFEGVSNVKEWGAIGDGKTDDTAAVQAAIKAVTSNAVGVTSFSDAASQRTLETMCPEIRGYSNDKSICVTRIAPDARDFPGRRNQL